MFDHNWTQSSIRDRVLRTIDVFGPSRIAFGSNFPVDRLYANYEKTIGAFYELTEEFTAVERSDMFHNVAAGFYRIAE
jgi:predicted TIM-barrel fold metal-dependent hydrolase